MNFNQVNQAEYDHDALKKYTINLNEMAKKGLLDPVIGRQSELDYFYYVVK